MKKVCAHDTPAHTGASTSTMQAGASTIQMGASTSTIQMGSSTSTVQAGAATVQAGASNVHAPIASDVKCEGGEDNGGQRAGTQGHLLLGELEPHMREGLLVDYILNKRYLSTSLNSCISPLSSVTHVNSTLYFLLKLYELVAYKVLHL